MTTRERSMKLWQRRFAVGSVVVGHLALAASTIRLAQAFPRPWMCAFDIPWAGVAAGVLVAAGPWVAWRCSRRTIVGSAAVPSGGRQ
jgi:hypothetical protein